MLYTMCIHHNQVFIIYSFVKELYSVRRDQTSNYFIVFCFIVSAFFCNLRAVLQCVL